MGLISIHDIRLKRYHKLRENDELKTGDLLQWETNNLVMWFYRWCTRADVNHSSMILRIPEYQGVRKIVFTTEADGKGGAALHRLSLRLRGHHGKVWLYRLVRDENPLAPEITDELRNKIGEAVFGDIGKNYDYQSVLLSCCGTFLRLRWKFFQKLIPPRWEADEKNLFCSEYLFFAYLQAKTKEDEEVLRAKGAPLPQDLVKVLKIFKKDEQPLYDSQTNDILSSIQQIKTLLLWILVPAFAIFLAWIGIRNFLKC